MIKIIGLKYFILFIFLTFLFSVQCYSQSSKPVSRKEMKEKAFSFWKGTKTKMTFLEFASHCAPIFWYSPDEPELKLATGKNIKIPSHFPFDEHCDSPVVYYQITEILTRNKNSGSAIKKNFMHPDSSVMDLSKISAVNIDYNHYYRFEAGLGGHNHDTEQAKFKILIRKLKENDTAKYQLVFIEATGKAHALSWYDNIYSIDTTTFETKLPMHILVEEGKHASCTDMNGDGYYSPGYDVNKRVNDAWGIRDVIRTGTLFSSSFESYMQKIRKPEHRVFPPLPEDSPIRKYYIESGVYAGKNAVYRLRPMPKPEKAGSDLVLRKDMEGYSQKTWPIVKEDSYSFLDFFESEQVIKSFAFSYRNDNGISGVSLAFPLLIVKNVEMPIIGGWIVNRIYAQDIYFRDQGFSFLYTNSASGFMDSYISAGVEFNRSEEKDSLQNAKLITETDFAMELGLKFRANIRYSPLKFLSVISDFWGVRIGIKNTGFTSINRLNYIFEVGAGVW